jgi:DNA-binding NarL/FixJ family response regulator
VGSRRVSVVVLYAHPLLGEGIDRLLSSEQGLDVTCVPMTAIDQAERALAAHPDVVVVERSDPVNAVDILKFAPDALFIDVGIDSGPSWTYRREEIPGRVEGIVAAIRSTRRRAARVRREAIRVGDAGAAEAPAVAGS